jgi:DNA repair exonuclease SbcCD ATPase subunit
MRLNHLKLHDFRCFHDLELAFDRPVNFIFGPNASGKSTIAEAMEMALTGQCNGFHPGWRERAALSRQGSEGYRIDLNTQLPGEAVAQKIVHRPDPKDCAPRTEEIAHRLGVNPEALTALFDTGHWFSLHPDDKKRLVFDLLGLRVTKDNLEAHLTSWLSDQAGLIRRHNLGPGENLLSTLGEIPETLEEAHQQAFDERRIVKRELRSLSGERGTRNGERGTADGMTPDLIRQRTGEIRTRLDGLLTRLGELKGMAAAEKGRLEREVQQAAASLDRLRAEAAGFDPQAETQAQERLEDRRAELKDTLERGNRVREDLEAKLQALHAEEARKRAIQSRVERFDGACPLLVQDPPVACETPKILQAIAGIKEGFQGDMVKIQGQKKALEKEREEIVGLLRESTRELQEVERGISGLELRKVRHQEALSRIRELEARKVRAEGILAGLDHAKVAESERVRIEIQTLQGDLERNQDLLRIGEQAERSSILEHKLAVLEVLTLAFSPKGIMADLLARGVKSLNDSLTAAMEKISGGQYSLEMGINDDVDLYLVDHRAGTRTGLRFASASERFRAGIVLQSVLSNLTGLRFMVIDGLDILDQENRGFFFRFVQEVKADFDSIFVFSTIGRCFPKDPGLPDVAFWVIEEGTVRRLGNEE